MKKTTRLLATSLLAFCFSLIGCSNFHAPLGPDGKPLDPAAHKTETPVAVPAASNDARAPEIDPAADEVAKDETAPVAASVTTETVTTTTTGPVLGAGTASLGTEIAEPPLPMAEQRPVIDNPRAFLWKPGYWRYDNGQYSWVPGQVVSKPAPTAVWAPDHWEKRIYGWVFVPGFWQ